MTVFSFSLSLLSFSFLFPQSQGSSVTILSTSRSQTSRFKESWMFPAILHTQRYHRTDLVEHQTVTFTADFTMSSYRHLITGSSMSDSLTKKHWPSNNNITVNHSYIFRWKPLDGTTRQFFCFLSLSLFLYPYIYHLLFCWIRYPLSSREPCKTVDIVV